MPAYGIRPYNLYSYASMEGRMFNSFFDGEAHRSLRALKKGKEPNASQHCRDVRE
jgi:hypothetical protein